jgi:hypothetical protein
VSLHKPKEGVGEAAALSGHAASLAGDGEVLAGEAAGPEGGTSAISPRLDPPSPARSAGLISSIISGIAPPSLPRSEMLYVAEVGDVGPPLREDGAGVGVDLAEADGAPACSLKAEVEAADA